MTDDGTIIQVGDTVVSMLAPGHFRVVRRDGEHLEIENGRGLRRTVRETNVRLAAPAEGAPPLD